MNEFKKLVFIHTSLQFSDTGSQKESDVKKIFAQNADIFTGTEAGLGRSENTRRFLKAECKRRGYVFHVKGDTWVAVKKDIIQKKKIGKGKDFSKGSVGPVIASAQGTGRHTNKYITYITFEGVDGLGKISVGVGHYLTKGRPNARPGCGINIKWNKLYAKAIGKWARAKGKGTALAFYAGDQNIVDKFADTFFGEPLTTSWDELKKWPNTGHGNIDVIASYDKDGRTEWVKADAYNDKRFPLNTDHFMVKSVAKIRLLKNKLKKSAPGA